MAAATATSSVQARWAIEVATSQPSAGVGVRQPASSRSATIASRTSPSTARSARIGRVLGSVTRGPLVGRSRARSATEGRLEGVGPVVEDAVAAGDVVGDEVGQAEAAHEVEGGLHQLAVARQRLVDAERVDGGAVGGATDPGLEVGHRLAQGGVGARGHPELRGRDEERAGEQLGQHPEHGAGAAAAGRAGRRSGRAPPRDVRRSGARPRPAPGRPWSGSGGAGPPG